MTTKSLPERLREGANKYAIQQQSDVLLTEAAARIEALEAQMAWMRRALEPFAIHDSMINSAASTPGELVQLLVGDYFVGDIAARDFLKAKAAMRSTVSADVVCVPHVSGVGRMFDNEKALLVILDRKPTDDEVRSIHDVLRNAAFSTLRAALSSGGR